MNESVITVIMPTYNRAEFIVLAIESVLAQNFKRWTLLVIDDGSTDNTKEAISHLLVDKRINYLYQENQGQSIARNLGLKLATTKWICFLDSDNLWPIEKLHQCLLASNDHPVADVIYGDVINIDVDGNEISRNKMRRYSGRITAPLLRDNFITINTVMVKKVCFDRLGGFNAFDRVAEDYELWLRLSTQFNFTHVPKFLAFYRVMKNQISSDKDARFLANLQILKNFKCQYPKAVTWYSWRSGFSAFYARRAGYQSAQHDYTSAFLSLSLALIHNPFWLGPWRILVKIVLGKY